MFFGLFFVVLRASNLTGFVLRPSANQCDQIGRFLQVLGNKLSHKSFQNIFVSFWAISNNVTVRKSVWLLLGNIRGEVRQLFIPSSGHADLVMSVCSEATFLGQTGDNEIVLSKIFKRGR